MARQNRKTLLLSAALLSLLLALITQPAAAYLAAQNGLRLWWQVVAPALLPFFIINELLLELGVSVLAGRAFRRLMQPLFALPGAAALPVLMGFCSGFPTGAAIVARLRQQNALSRDAAERAVAFTNNAGPLYLTVGVAVGLLHMPGAAAALCVAHYGADLLLGLLLGALARRRGPDCRREAPPEAATLFPVAPWGQLLKTAAGRALRNILLIGAYMTFFAAATALPARLLPDERPLLRALLLGLCEMSLGLQALTECGLPPAMLLPAAAAMISFGGFSVQSQVLAMLADSDIRPRRYLLARPLQAALAFQIALPLTRRVSHTAAGFAFVPGPRPPLLLYSVLLALLSALPLLMLLRRGHC